MRRAWPECAYSGYSLKKIAFRLGIEFQHHVAAEDARAAGEIILRAIADTGRSLEDWFLLVKQPISDVPIVQAGNPNGPLAGEVLVFTGALTVHRREAAEWAAKAGCEVAESVNKSTTLLIVGNQDIRQLAGHDKSSKHRKAEQLIAKGQGIRILTESDFGRLLLVTQEH